MNKEGGAAAAAMLNPAVRAQIRSLSERDGVPSDQISAMLGIPELLVTEILSKTSIVSDGPNGGDVDKQLSDRAASIEDRLADAEQTAVAVLEDVCANAQSDGVRLAAAERILEIRTGKLRPQKQAINKTEITIETMNTLIQQATVAYHAQRATPPVAAPTIPKVETIERN